MHKGINPVGFSKMTTQDVMKSLTVDQHSGLAKSEVQNRLKLYGYNEVIEKKANPIARFLKKFWGISTWMLELIMVLSWILRKFSDVYIIGGLLVINAIISFLEEQNASNAVEALKKKLQVNARVLRDSQWLLIPAKELVPGDIVRVRSGDFVPADSKIITGELMIDQSALTGESGEIEKMPDDALYSGSVVKRGEASGVIILTGAKTYFGKTTELVQVARPKLHMDEVVSKVVKWLLAIVGILLSIALVFSVLRGINLLEILPLMLVVLLSAIPVALPVMFTVSMAIGARELTKKDVLVTRLSASEDAATMNVLCVDKTGTITMNKLTISNVMPLNGFDERDVLLYGALASQEANQDPIDLAFITLAKQKNLIEASFIQKAFVPFDPKTRRTESLVQKGSEEFRVMKGAVEVIAGACGLNEQAIRELKRRMDDFAIKGYRTLAVAKFDQTQGKVIGLVALYDMPRPDSKGLIEQLKELGISVKMLTGDALPIAEEIAKNVGLVENVTKISDLKKLSSENLLEVSALIEKSDVFAEVYPEDKYIIVNNLQTKGYVVGMTGDGVNDAPALRQAEVGIAVFSATDVAKGAASVVLTSEGLASIVDLVKNGRRIYQRIITWVLNKIMRTILKSSFVVLAFLITGKYVISAFAMILLVFMTDFVKISLSTDNVRWSKAPDTWRITGLVKLSIILGILTVIESLGLLFIGFKFFNLTTGNLSIHTFSFEILFFFAVFSLFIVRERKHFWNSMPSKTLLLAISLDMLLATIISTVGIKGVLRPLPLNITIFVILYAFIFSLIINDFIKFFLIKKYDVK